MYIGKEPANSFISFEKQVFTIVNSQTAYTLNNSVTNENDIRLVINNVIQEPGSGKAYTASGTTLTLSAALTNGTDEMYCVYLGRALQTVNAPDGSVGSSQVEASIITGQTELATAPASTDELLISDAGTLKRMDVSLIGEKNTPYFEMSLSSNQTGLSDNTATKIQFDTSDLDSDSGVDVSTNYRYTVQSGDAGKYFLIATATGETASGDDNKDTSVFIYKNGSSVAKTEFETSSSSDAYRIGKTLYTIQNLSEGDYIETFIQINSSSNANTNIAKQGCRMSGFKITSS